MITVQPQDPSGGTDPNAKIVPGYQYDPSTVVQGSDGKWYALDSTGNVVPALGPGIYGTGYTPSTGANAAQTKPLVERQLQIAQQNRDRLNSQGMFDAVGDTLGSGFNAFKEALPGTALVLGAGALGGAFGGLGAGSAAPGWTSGYDLAGGGALGDAATAGTAADAWDFAAPGTTEVPSTAADYWKFAPPDAAPEGQGAPVEPGSTQQQLNDFPKNQGGTYDTMYPVPPGANASDVAPGASTNWLQDLLKSGGTQAQTGGALARLLSGNGTASDVASLLGNLGTGLVDAYGANKQADTLKELSDKYLAIGAPSRERYNASFAPGFTMANDPGYTDALNQTSKGILHGLSVQGNPADSPNAWAQSLNDLNAKFAYPALQDYRNTNANTGGFGAFNAAAPGAAQTAAGAQSNVYNVAGKTLANITNPSTNYADLLKQLSGYSNIFGTS